MATTLYASTPPDTDADTLQRQVDEDICRVARQRWKQAVEEDARLDELMLEDLRFENGEQWEERTRVQRERDRRPALTVNRLLPVIRQVTNDEPDDKQRAEHHHVLKLADVKCESRRNKEKIPEQGAKRGQKESRPSTQPRSGEHNGEQIKQRDR